MWLWLFLLQSAGFRISWSSQQEGGYEKKDYRDLRVSPVAQHPPTKSNRMQNRAVSFLSVFKSQHHHLTHLQEASCSQFSLLTLEITNIVYLLPPRLVYQVQELLSFPPASYAPCKLCSCAWRISTCELQTHAGFSWMVSLLVPGGFGAKSCSSSGAWHLWPLAHSSSLSSKPADMHFKTSGACFAINNMNTNKLHQSLSFSRTAQQALALSLSWGLLYLGGEIKAIKLNNKNLAPNFYTWSV